MPETFAIIDLSKIKLSSTNPRRTHCSDALAELAKSISMKGVLQPLIVRPDGEFYEIVCGERRFRAATQAGCPDVPCMVRDLSEMDVLEIQIIENDQREDVAPLEQADGYQMLIDAGHSIETIAAKIGRPNRYVSGRLALRELDPKCRTMLETGNMSLGAAMRLAKSGLSAEFSKRDGFMTSPVRDQTVINFINSRFRWLDQAKFPIADADLEPAAGPCTTCLFNTGCNPNLFGESDDPEKGQCTNPPCHDRKLNAWVFHQLRTVPGLRAITKEGDAEFGWAFDSYSKHRDDHDPADFPLTGIFTTDDNRKGDAIQFRGREDEVGPDRNEEWKAKREAERKAVERRIAATARFIVTLVEYCGFGLGLFCEQEGIEYDEDQGAFAMLGQLSQDGLTYFLLRVVQELSAPGFTSGGEADEEIKRLAEIADIDVDAIWKASE